MRKQFRYLDTIIALFAVSLLVSNIAATKLIAFGSIIVDGGAVLFPIIYIFGDILTEVYGYRYARRAIWIGFVAMIIATLAFILVRALPAAPMYTDQAAFGAVLGFFPRIVFASITAYLAGSFVNAYILARLKVKTKGRALWQRLVGSTLAGESIDTIVFCLIAFADIVNGWDMVNYIVVGWTFKVMVEIIFLPVTYRVVAWLKAAEHSDAYDRKTDFSPVHDVF